MSQPFYGSRRVPEQRPRSPHGELRELFPDVYFISGGVRMGPGISVSRNMVVVRQAGELTLIHTIRLNEAGLTALEALGTVKHVIRLAGFHGMDDPFYKDRYGAEVWNVEGMVYAKGFSAAKPNPTPYFEADHAITAESALPIEGASLYQLKSARGGEGLLRHWHKTDRFFSFLAKPMMRIGGFLKAHNVGPGWIKAAKPDVAEVHAILDLEFEHVLPVHGTEVIGGAKEKYRKAIELL